MKKLTERQLRAIENWIYSHARPLEVAKWKLIFDKGSGNDVVTAMQKYQNDDGGFGNGFEADTLAPESAAISSAEAIFTAQDYGLDFQSEWAKKLLHYFEKTCQNTPSFWTLIPKSIDDYPHPPWLNYSPDTQFSPNPCAGIASALIVYGTDSQRALGNEIAQKSIDFLNSGDICFGHQTYCLQRLYAALRDVNSNLIDEQTTDSMKRRISADVCYDKSKWTEYVAQPLDLIDSPASPWYPLVESGVENNIDYWINSLSDEGCWQNNFSWGVDTDVSRRVSQNWKGYIAVSRVRILRAFDAVGGN